MLQLTRLRGPLRRGASSSGEGGQISRTRLPYGAALGVGLTGRSALEVIRRTTPELPRTIYGRQLARTAKFDAIGVGAAALAILLIFLT